MPGKLPEPDRNTEINLVAIYDRCESCKKIWPVDDQGFVIEHTFKEGRRHRDCPGGGILCITLILAIRAMKTLEPNNE